MPNYPPQPRQQSKDSLLDATGTGTLTFLVPWSEQWAITRYTVGTNNANGDPIPTCHVYKNTETAGSLIEATYDGSQDTSADPLEGQALRSGEQLVFVWRGGTSGEEATATIFYQMAVINL